MNKAQLTAITKIIEKNNSKIKLLTTQLDSLVAENGKLLALIPQEIFEKAINKPVAESLESSDTNTAI